MSEDVKGPASRPGTGRRADAGATPAGGPAWADEPVLPVLLDEAVRRFGDRPAIDFMGRVWSYRAIGRLVDQVADGLRRLGICKGRQVGLLLPNTPYSVIFYFAVLKAGGIVVNYNPLYTARELAVQIRDSRTTVMVVMDLERLYRPVAEIARESGLSHLIVCPMAEVLPFPKGLLFRLFRRADQARIPDDGMHVPFRRLLRGSPVPRAALPAANDVAVLQYTGGTTGIPKGAMLTHANLMANARQIVSFAGPGALREGEERVLVILPLFHVFAMTVALNTAVRIGAQMILVPRFQIAETLDTIKRTRPTLLPAVPTIYSALSAAAEKGGVDLTSIRLCISGGAPLPVEVKTRFEALTGCRLAEGYGLTEASPVISVNPLDGRPGRVGSAGLALPDTVIEIRDLADPTRLMPVGEKGEVCVRGPQVMAGYWHRPADTRAVLIDGRLRTGDVGFLDADGFLFLVDRLKDLIICSGYNVYPRVIEEALYEHADVAEAIVIGVPDAYRGESPKAFVVLKEGAEATEADLKAFLATRISKIEMPGAIEFRDSLPKTMVGKLSRKELVAEDRERRAAAPAATGDRLSGN